MARTPPVLLRLLEVENLRLVVLSVGLVLCLAILVIFAASGTVPGKGAVFTIQPYLLFFYATFLKPHKETPEHGQQSALENFYATQVGGLLPGWQPQCQYHLGRRL
jgi:hypothetical protein